MGDKKYFNHLLCQLTFTVVCQIIFLGFNELVTLEGIYLVSCST